MDRRDFLKTAATVSGASMIPALNPISEKAEALEKGSKRIVVYNPLGKTGLKVSDIAFGAGKLPSNTLAERAFDMGINYWDTAPDYGLSETFLGKFLENRKADRSKIIITTKICNAEPYPGHMRIGASVAEIMKNVDGSLRRLKTDYIDFIFIHAVAERSNDVERITDLNHLEAIEKLKKSGKVRFAGFSSHGPYDMEKTVSAAVDTGMFDIMMVAFNFNEFPNLKPVIKKAYANGMGVLAMKTLAGAKHADLERFKQDGAAFEQAALRWVNSHKEIAGAVITINNVDKLRNYVAVSGSKLASSDTEILNRYTETFGNEICRTGCGECLPACAKGVNIAEILRYQMYFENYPGYEERAVTAYNALKVNGSDCVSCVRKKGGLYECESACRFGLPVPELLARAHHSLHVS